METVVAENGKGKRRELLILLLSQLCTPTTAAIPVCSQLINGSSTRGTHTNPLSTLKVSNITINILLGCGEWAVEWRRTGQQPVILAHEKNKAPQTREQGQVKFIFPCSSVDHKQDWQLIFVLKGWISEWVRYYWDESRFLLAFVRIMYSRYNT